MRRLFIALAVILAGCGAAPTSGDEPFFTRDGEGQGAIGFVAVPSGDVYINYTGTGTCDSLGFRFVSRDPQYDLDTPPPAPSSGGKIRGSWYLSMKPGTYALTGGAPGCAWTVSIREWGGMPGF